MRARARARAQLFENLKNARASARGAARVRTPPRLSTVQRAVRQPETVQADLGRVARPGARGSLKMLSLFTAASACVAAAASASASGASSASGSAAAASGPSATSAAVSAGSIAAAGTADVDARTADEPRPTFRFSNVHGDGMVLQVPIYPGNNNRVGGGWGIRNGAMAAARRPVPYPGS